MPTGTPRLAPSPPALSVCRPRSWRGLGSGCFFQAAAQGTLPKVSFLAAGKPFLIEESQASGSQCSCAASSAAPLTACSRPRAMAVSLRFIFPSQGRIFRARDTAAVTNHRRRTSQQHLPVCLGGDGVGGGCAETMRCGMTAVPQRWSGERDFFSENAFN